MTFVLHYGVVEEILNFAVIEYLRPLFLLAVAKEPAFVILQLEYDDTHLGRYNHIDLNIRAIVTTDVEVVIDVLGLDAEFSKF